MTNNELLFKEQHIGSFYMHRVLLSHIYPRVFICNTDKNEKYLFYEVESREHTDRWLGVKISDTECEAVSTKKCSVQSLYTSKPANELVTFTKVYFDESDDDNTFVKQDGWKYLSLLPDVPVYMEEEQSEKPAEIVEVEKAEPKKSEEKIDYSQVCCCDYCINPSHQKGGGCSESACYGFSRFQAAPNTPREIMDRVEDTQDSLRWG